MWTAYLQTKVSEKQEELVQCQSKSGGTNRRGKNRAEEEVECERRTKRCRTDVEEAIQDVVEDEQDEIYTLWETAKRTEDLRVVEAEIRVKRGRDEDETRWCGVRYRKISNDV